jgi:putative endonuclease
LTSSIIGSCQDTDIRLDQHLSGIFSNAFTSKAKDWTKYFQIDNLEYQQARKIETHIKRMKSRKFIENLKKYPELSKKLMGLYQ